MPLEPAPARLSEPPANDIDVVDEYRQEVARLRAVITGLRDAFRGRPEEPYQALAAYLDARILPPEGGAR